MLLSRRVMAQINFAPWAGVLRDPTPAHRDCHCEMLPFTRQVRLLRARNLVDTVPLANSARRPPFTERKPPNFAPETPMPDSTYPCLVCRRNAS